MWYSGTPVGLYCQKSLAKRGGFGKNKKGENSHIGGREGVSGNPDV